MTNEERIRYLKGLLKCELCEEESTKICKSCDNRRIGSSAKCYDALKEAIKAIEQEPCDDAISRSEALKTINNMDIPEDMSTFEIMSHIGVEIGTLPPVQPKSKTGHWIYEKRKRLINETDEGTEYVTDYWCKCSKCGGDFGYRKMKDAFCKYCGAKMVEPLESEEE